MAGGGLIRGYSPGAMERLWQLYIQRLECVCLYTAAARGAGGKVSHCDAGHGLEVGNTVVLIYWVLGAG